MAALNVSALMQVLGMLGLGKTYLSLNQNL